MGLIFDVNVMSYFARYKSREAQRRNLYAVPW